MVNDFFSTLRTYLNKVRDGEKSPAEVAAALNSWARESGEALKNKINQPPLVLVIGVSSQILNPR